jgi:hypothetical protein
MEPITYKTPAGKELKIIPKLNAGQRNTLRKIMSKMVKLSVEQIPDPTPAEPGKMKMVPRIDGFDTDAMENRDRTLIEVGVKEYDGKADNVYGRLLESDPEEYDFVVETLSTNLAKGLGTF